MKLFWVNALLSEQISCISSTKQPCVDGVEPYAQLLVVDDGDGSEDGNNGHIDAVER